jgi:hypothetical protein
VTAPAVFQEGEEDAEAFPTRRFKVWETTSGLPDDSREEDERQEARRIRDLRGRVKRAHTVVACTPGLEDVLRADWKLAAQFYARFGISEKWLREGIDIFRDEPELVPDWIQSIAVTNAHRMFGQAGASVTAHEVRSFSYHRALPLRPQPDVS